MGMSIAQQGSGFPFFSLTGYRYLCHQDTGSLDIILADVPLQNAREFLEKVWYAYHGYRVEPLLKYMLT